MLLNEASEEQLNIVKLLVDENKNVRVDAVAGSGKTTTCLHLAKYLQEKGTNNGHVLVITYNRKLRLESKQRALKLDIFNIDFHTYHSSAGTFYGVKYGSSYDGNVNGIVEKNAPIKHINKYHTIVLDECQDMTPLLYYYSKKLIKDLTDNGNVLNVLIIGDSKQEIYSYMGSDFRFLTLSHILFEREFVDCTLSTSYRLTKEIAKFVNYNLGYNRIKTAKSDNDNIKVTLFCGKNQYGYTNEIISMLKLLFNEGYKEDDIFILSDSVKTNPNKRDRPVINLANTISKRLNKPIYRPVSDDIEINSDEIKGKILVSSYHQSKGMERNIVIVYNYSHEYFKYGKSNSINSGNVNPLQCPNEMYVALTRSLKYLFVIGDIYYPPWISKYIPNNNDFVIFKGNNPSVTKFEQSEDFVPSELTTTQLTDHLSSSIMIECEKRLKDMFKHYKSDKKYHLIDICDNIKIKHNENELTEGVSDLNGILIPTYYEYKKSNKSTIFDYLYGNSEKELKFPVNNIKNLITMVIKYEKETSGYSNRNIQIDEKYRDWILHYQLNESSKRLGDFIDNYSKFDFEYPTSRLYCNTNIIGRIDGLSDNDIWEFKCVKNLTTQNKLQLIIYAWLLNNKKFKMGYLLNIKTGECLEINLIEQFENITNIVNMILDEKFKLIKRLDDKTFIRKIMSKGNNNIHNEPDDNYYIKGEEGNARENNDEDINLYECLL